MNDIIYIKSLIQNNVEIMELIKLYKKSNIDIIKQHNNISYSLNSNIETNYHNINNKFNIINNNLNYFFSLMSQYNSFVNIICKIKESNNYYQDKIIINNKLLEKNNKIFNYIEQIFNYANYRDIINLINENLSDENLLDENLLDENLSDENLSDENLSDENNRKENISNDNDFYNVQLKYYNEIEQYVENMKENTIKNVSNSSNDFQIDYLVDKDIKIINEIIVIIKNRANRNRQILENNNKKIKNIIQNNNNLYDYLYNFSMVFQYFNINFNYYFNNNIPKLPIFNNNIDNINNIFFENFSSVYEKLITYSYTISNNSIDFSFKISNLKSYFNFLKNFFDLTKLKLLLHNFNDQIISKELFDIFNLINSKIDFINLQEQSIEFLDLLENFTHIHENYINSSKNTLLDLKKNFYSNYINRIILIKEYNFLIYDIILYILHVNNIKEINIDSLEHILDSKKCISILAFDKIVHYISLINEINEKLLNLNNQKTEYEQIIIEQHELLQEYTIKLQKMLANNYYENSGDIIEKNKHIIIIEEKIKTIIDDIYKITIEIENTNIYNINIKKTITNEILSIIEYYN